MILERSSHSFVRFAANAKLTGVKKVY